MGPPSWGQLTKLKGTQWPAAQGRDTELRQEDRASFAVFSDKPPPPLHRKHAPPRAGQKPARASHRGDKQPAGCPVPAWESRSSGCRGGLAVSDRVGQVKGRTLESPLRHFLCESSGS